MDELTLLNYVEAYMGPCVRKPRSTHKGLQAAWRCPFHKSGEERRPSFFLNLTKGVAYCHTCDDWWTAGYLLRTLGAPVRLYESVARQLREERGTPKRRKQAPVIELPESLLAIFEAGGCPTRLLDAGFDMELLRHFEIGYDSLHERITYPIRNYDRMLVGIAGGATKKSQHPKYLFYGKRELEKFLPEHPVPEEPVEKSFYLWNLHRVWAACAYGEPGPVTVVEGYKALLRVVQAGYKLVVHPFGSYLSDEQIDLLLALGRPVISFFDLDEGGEKGRRKSVPRLLDRGGRVRYARYPNGRLHGDGGPPLQPDDLTPAQIVQAHEESTLWHSNPHTLPVDVNWRTVPTPVANPETRRRRVDRGHDLPFHER